LKCLGYELNGLGDYVYRIVDSTSNEMTKRKNAANEFQNFFNDLKKIKEGSLNGFEEFIQVTFFYFNIKFEFEFYFLRFRFREQLIVHNHIMMIMMMMISVQNNNHSEFLLINIYKKKIL